MSNNLTPNKRDREENDVTSDITNLQPLRKKKKINPASHYNQRPDQGKIGRDNSTIRHMRRFNNWIKSILINTYCPRNAIVLDFCCGKFGDLHKWKKVHAKYVVGADIAFNSLKDAVIRYNDSKPQQFGAEFICGDCFKIDLLESIDENLFFDICSSQFSLHYSFGEEKRVRQMFHNVSSHLKVGGFFIGTIPNSNWIVKKIRAENSLKIGNKVYCVDFKNVVNEEEVDDNKATATQNDESILDPTNDDNNDNNDNNNNNNNNSSTNVNDFEFLPFGAEYLFSLESAVDNCPEYLVNFKLFTEIAKEYGLEIIEHLSFHDFFRKYRKNQKYLDLLYRMRVLNEEGSISKEEWEAIGIYKTFTFKKIVNYNDLHPEGIFEIPLPHLLNNTNIKIVDLN
eukprot:TRINITY_DN143_c4_g1_i1.p1 TRINITY_DN143_c4_g1~~TRINITY_DN143_c4_g1_i1.p1  ORF type:complete len:397 (+),score=123.44 TRINITY_DN143_c4_g1_i1:133-1323(+)